MTRLELSSEPASEPVTLSELKTNLRIDDSDEDTLITNLGKAARKVCEDYCYRSFITQTWKLYLRDWPSVILLPRGPVQSVTSVKYTDTDGNLQTIDSSNYATGLKGDVAIIDPIDSWEATDTDYPEGIEVEFIAGYGDDGSDVPEPIKNAIKILVGDLYQTRQTITTRNINTISFNGFNVWQYLLNPYKIYL